MKLAYFSPFSPQRSGISAYSEELLPYLAVGAEIDLFVDGFKPAHKPLRHAHRWFNYQDTPAVLQRLRDYDAVLYHMGNDHRYHAGIYQTACAFPGIVVLHDYDLHTFFKGLANTSQNMRLYHDEVAACADVAPPPAAKTTQPSAARNATQPAALRASLNCRVARNAEALIVPCEESRARLSQIAPAVPSAQINHHAQAIEQSAQAYLDFIREVIEQRARRRFVRRVSTELAHLDPKQTNDIFLRGVAAEIAQLAPAKIFAAQDIL